MGVAVQCICRIFSNRSCTPIVAAPGAQRKKWQSHACANPVGVATIASGKRLLVRGRSKAEDTHCYGTVAAYFWITSR